MVLMRMVLGMIVLVMIVENIMIIKVQVRIITLSIDNNHSATTNPD